MSKLFFLTTTGSKHFSLDLLSDKHFFSKKDLAPPEYLMVRPLVPGSLFFALSHRIHRLMYLMIQIYSGITLGKVLNVELYTQRLQKLIYLCLFTDCFMKIVLHSFMKISLPTSGVERNLHDTVCRRTQII